MKAAITRALNRAGYDVVARTNLQRIPLDRDTFARVLYFQRMFARIERVQGDIVECGVGRGKSMLLMALLNCESTRPRDMWGFDSFEGFPDPTTEDDSLRKPKKGEWNVTSIHGILRLLRDSGIDYHFTRTRMFLIQGFFPQVFEKYTGKKIALLHLDVDLYQSYKDCLESLYDRVATGGVIMFDEYNNTQDHLHYPGAYKAISEFLKSKKLSAQKDPSGKYFVVKK